METKYAEFDRFDIAEAYKVVEIDYNVGGILQERPSCQRRAESVGAQLHRIGFKAPSVWDYDDLSDNGKAIYDNAVERLGLPK